MFKILQHSLRKLWKWERLFNLYILGKTKILILVQEGVIKINGHNKKL